VPIYILKWGNVLDDMTPLFHADAFAFTHDTCGAEGVYKGVVMKRLPQIFADDFVLVPAKQTLFFDIDVLQGYWLPENGTYNVVLRDQVWQFHTEVNQLENFDYLKEIEVTTNTITADVTTVSAAPGFPEPENKQGLLGVTFSNCIASEQTTITTAHNNAVTMVKTVNSYMSGSGGTTKTHYVTWFGVYSSANWNTVQKNFANIGTRINGAYNVDCKGSECKANIYAYVYPSDAKFNVYVCGAFWNANVNTCQVDSKPGTLIHEISHFTPVAGTSDYAYGQSSCKSLASSNPSRAIANADNHEYMAEACPT